jgi:hypothetical protein
VPGLLRSYICRLVVESEQQTHVQTADRVHCMHADGRGPTVRTRLVVNSVALQLQLRNYRHCSAGHMRRLRTTYVRIAWSYMYVARSIRSLLSKKKKKLPTTASDPFGSIPIMQIRWMDVHHVRACSVSSQSMWIE